MCRFWVVYLHMSSYVYYRSVEINKDDPNGNTQAICSACSTGVIICVWQKYIGRQRSKNASEWKKRRLHVCSGGCWGTWKWCILCDLGSILVLSWKQRIKNRAVWQHWWVSDHPGAIAAELMGQSSVYMYGLAIVHLHIPLGWEGPQNWYWVLGDVHFL